MERLNELKKGFGAFAKISPDVIGAFGQMRGACCREGGALDLAPVYLSDEVVPDKVGEKRELGPCAGGLPFQVPSF